MRLRGKAKLPDVQNKQLNAFCQADLKKIAHRNKNKIVCVYSNSVGEKFDLFAKIFSNKILIHHHLDPNYQITRLPQFTKYNQSPTTFFNAACVASINGFVEIGLPTAAFIQASGVMAPSLHIRSISCPKFLSFRYCSI